MVEWLLVQCFLNFPLVSFIRFTISPNAKQMHKLILGCYRLRKCGCKLLQWNERMGDSRTIKIYPGERLLVFAQIPLTGPMHLSPIAVSADYYYVQLHPSPENHPWLAETVSLEDACELQHPLKRRTRISHRLADTGMQNCCPQPASLQGMTTLRLLSHSRAPHEVRLSPDVSKNHIFA